MWTVQDNDGIGLLCIIPSSPSSHGSEVARLLLSKEHPGTFLRDRAVVPGIANTYQRRRRNPPLLATASLLWRERWHVSWQWWNGCSLGMNGMANCTPKHCWLVRQLYLAEGPELGGCELKPFSTEALCQNVSYTYTTTHRRLWPAKPLTPALHYLRRGGSGPRTPTFEPMLNYCTHVAQLGNNVSLAKGKKQRKVSLHCRSHT